MVADRVILGRGWMFDELAEVEKMLLRGAALGERDRLPFADEILRRHARGGSGTGVPRNMILRLRLHYPNRRPHSEPKGASLPTAFPCVVGRGRGAAKPSGRRPSSRFSNFFFLRNEIVVCCSNAFVTPGNRHGRTFTQLPSDSRLPREAKRRRRASTAVGEFVADERGGKFSAAQSFENSENVEGISLRQSPIRFPCRAVPSLPGNGAATA
jgi:hypothetical protein